MLALLASLSQATDRRLAELSRRLAARLLLAIAQSGPTARASGRRLRRAPADDASLDLDLDASFDGVLEARSQRRPLQLDDLIATRWERPTVAVCLLVDRSGSMSGERLATAALAAAICTWRGGQELSVFAFGQHVIELKPMGHVADASSVVGRVLGLRGYGTTDLAAALLAARRAQAASTSRRRVTLLLSDAEATTGGDPIPLARALEELIVIAPRDAQHLARTFADRAGARLGLVDRPSSIVAVLNEVLS